MNVFQVGLCCLHPSFEAVLCNKREHSYMCISRMAFTNTKFKRKGANDEMLKYESEFPHPSKKGDGMVGLLSSMLPELMFTSHGARTGKFPV